jgi:hypothetical protein
MHDTLSNGQVVKSAWVRFILVLFLIYLFPVTTYAGIPEQFHFRAGVCNSKNRPLNADQLQLLLDGLRQKTGWAQLRLDENGFLVIDDQLAVSGGSATARALLAAAVDGLHCLKLENHNYSTEVAFAQIRSTEIYVDAREIRHDVFHVEFDFKDFFELRGSSEVLAAFDPAIHLLHELGHAVWGLRDRVDATDQLGECERQVNQIRRELRLPERKYYEARTSLALMPGERFTSLKSELIFVQSEGPGRKAKESSLFFRTEKVLFANR